MIEVSIITPSIRQKGLDVVRNSLSNQSFTNFEWLIGSPFNPGIKDSTWVKDNFVGGYWSLNRMYNRLFAKARGAIIITWQDYIWAKGDSVERFVSNVMSTGGVVSGVGDQYESLNKFGKPEIKIWSDPRKTDRFGSFYECMPNDAEWNFCSFPKQAIIDVGGMDEELDFLGYGGDQLQASERMDAIGYKFYLDQENESYTLRHNRDDFGGQESWDKNHTLFNGTYNKRKSDLIESGDWPKLKYLV